MAACDSNSTVTEEGVRAFTVTTDKAEKRWPPRRAHLPPRPSGIVIGIDSHHEPRVRDGITIRMAERLEMKGSSPPQKSRPLTTVSREPHSFDLFHYDTVGNLRRESPVKKKMTDFFFSSNGGCANKTEKEERTYRFDHHL